MRNPEYQAQVQALLERAHGRWTSILKSLDVEPGILSQRNQPCPMCGGTDRFQYTDKFGEGNYHCRNCGPGGGFKLLQAVKGVDFKSAVRQVQEVIGSALLLLSAFWQNARAAVVGMLPDNLANQLPATTRIVQA